MLPSAHAVELTVSPSVVHPDLHPSSERDSLPQSCVYPLSCTATWCNLASRPIGDIYTQMVVGAWNTQPEVIVVTDMIVAFTRRLDRRMDWQETDR